MEKIQLSKRSKYWIISRSQPEFNTTKNPETKIDNIYLWFDLDDEDTKTLKQETTTDNKNIQELVLPASDIYNKEFRTGSGNDRINPNVYEIRTSPANVVILNIIVCKASHLWNTRHYKQTHLQDNNQK